MIKIASVVLCITLVGGCAAELAETTDDAVALAVELRNSDIEWDGTFVGLWPHVKGEAAKRLLALGERASPALRAALDDPEKFATAHVLLTHLEMNKYEVSVSHWNGLKVDIHADGTVDLYPEQMPEIKAMWVK